MVSATRLYLFTVSDPSDMRVVLRVSVSSGRVKSVMKKLSGSAAPRFFISCWVMMVCR